MAALENKIDFAIAFAVNMQENQSLYSLMIVPMMVPNRCRTGSIHI